MDELKSVAKILSQNWEVYASDDCFRVKRGSCSIAVFRKDGVVEMKVDAVTARRLKVKQLQSYKPRKDTIVIDWPMLADRLTTICQRVVTEEQIELNARELHTRAISSLDCALNSFQPLPRSFHVLPVDSTFSCEYHRLEKIDDLGFIYRLASSVQLSWTDGTRRKQIFESWAGPGPLFGFKFYCGLQIDQVIDLVKYLKRGEVG